MDDIVLDHYCAFIIEKRRQPILENTNENALAYWRIVHSHKATEEQRSYVLNIDPDFFKITEDEKKILSLRPDNRLCLGREVSREVSREVLANKRKPLYFRWFM